MNTSELDNHRSPLLELETKLLQELSTIHTRLNGLCLIISFLPTEILQIIFEFCIILDPTETQPHNKHHLAFTQVRRHWRNLALSTPGLWTTIDLSDLPFYTSLSLSRSGKAVISVISLWVPYTPSCSKESLELAKGRIWKMDLVSFLDSMVRLFCSISGRSLEFSGCGAGRLRMERLMELRLRVPGVCDDLADLTFLDVGRVRKLILSGVKVDWRSTGKELEVLELSGLDERFAPTKEELVGILGRARESIEEVCLDDVCCGGDVLPWTERLDTPLLWKITLSSKDQEFLEHIISLVTIKQSTEALVRCGGMKMTVIDGKVVNPLVDVSLSTEQLSMIAFLYPF
ncbi:hypothetical protein L218DRAFT_949259 [Marasmius fiardii PR-910]|nr:hypothetical protein L218DRAFT_949259 [Marasmius fiardii PR-910]